MDLRRISKIVRKTPPHTSLCNHDRYHTNSHRNLEEVREELDTVRQDIDIKIQNSANSNFYFYDEKIPPSKSYSALDHTQQMMYWQMNYSQTVL